MAELQYECGKPLSALAGEHGILDMFHLSLGEILRAGGKEEEGGSGVALKCAGESCSGHGFRFQVNPLTICPWDRAGNYLEWVAVPSKGFLQPWDQTQVSWSCM